MPRRTPALLWTIVKKEIVANLLSYKFFIAILLTTLLLFTSFFVLYKDYKGRLADYELVRAKPGEPIAVLPPNPLSIFAKGLDEAMARSFEISRIGIDVFAGQKSGNTIFAFFPTPDFVYIVKVVLSLVALLFGFDQISREKESGVLRLMLSNSVSRAKILAGKWLGNFLSLSVPFLLVTLLGFALINLDPSVRFSASSAARFFLLVLTALIYIALFLSLGIFVSALTRRAASSLVILLLIWAVTVFIVPNLGTLIARQMVDVPSVKALSEKQEQVWTREVLQMIMERRAKDDRGTGDIIKNHFDAINRELNQMEEDYRNKFDRLVRLSKNINRLSPAASFVYATTELAGTGIGEESRLKENILRYKDSVLPNLERGEKQAPAFAYRYRSVGQVLAQGGLFDLTWLVFFNILFFALGYFAFVRYDVR
jgi:ABC-type transport system involved in multi-copper enzyme maturation permease subunit